MMLTRLFGSAAKRFNNPTFYKNSNFTIDSWEAWRRWDGCTFGDHMVDEFRKHVGDVFALLKVVNQKLYQKKLYL